MPKLLNCALKSLIILNLSSLVCAPLNLAGKSSCNTFATLALFAKLTASCVPPSAEAIGADAV